VDLYREGLGGSQCRSHATIESFPSPLPPSPPSAGTLHHVVVELAYCSRPESQPEEKEKKFSREIKGYFVVEDYPERIVVF
jgi:hypothetical protein